MEDSMEEDSGESTQASTALIDNTMPEPPAPTPGRRRRRTTSARSRHSSAKPRGGGRKSTAGSTRPGGSARGRGRQARAPTTASEAFAAAFTANASPKVRHGIHVKPETAEEMSLEAITTESESMIDLQAEQYISKILPDPSTIIYTDQNSGRSAAPCSSYSVYGSCEEEPPVMSPQRRRSGRQVRSVPVRRRRRVAIEGDERVVSKPQAGRWSSLLPVGTVVRRPSIKLVQLVAQAIHESPHRVLRVTHVYAALQNKYPYYKLLDKRGINSWKSSVRHALFQKWFVKLCPTSVCENVRHRSCFWGLNYYLRPREWVMPQLQPSAFSSPVQVGASHRDDDDDASVLFSRMHLNNEPPNKTAAPAPSAFQLELEKRTFSPPETKTPLGRKRRRTATRDSSDCTPSVPQPSVDELAGPSSTSPLPHMDLWKTEYMKMDSWPEAHQASMSPPTSVTTSAVPTMASPAFVEAAVDSFQSSWQQLSGEQFLQLRRDEQQQMTLMAQQAMTQQPQQQTLQESLQQSPEFQQTWGQFVRSPEGGQLMDMIRSAERECPAQLFDDKFSPVGSPQGEHSHGATTYSTNGQFSPRSVLCSPAHLTQTPSSPGYTALPSSDVQPPLLSPKLQKDAHFMEPLEVVPMHCLGGLISAFGLPPVDYTGGVAVCLRVPLPVWKRLRQRCYVRKNVERGQWIAAIVTFPMCWSKPEESPTRRDNGDDMNDCDDGDLLPLEEPGSCSAPAPTDPDPSAPTDEGDRCKLESASTPALVGMASPVSEST